MSVPKGFRNNINIHPQTIGPERRKEILNGIAAKGTFLPRGVLEEDMDEAFIDFVNKDLQITIDGEIVPVYFFTIQRWSEFNQTWGNSDKYKHIKIPFISIVRNPDIQEGQNQAGLWNIAGGRTYTYIKEPTFDGVREGMLLYKIPQPTPIDITYEILIYSNRIKDLNKLNRKVRKLFQSRQHYINVNGHPMPLHNEGVSDESSIEDIQTRRYYVVTYEMLLMGYILDEEDFEEIPTINRAMVFTEITSTENINSAVLNQKINTNLTGSTTTIDYDFIFKPNSSNIFSFSCKYNLTFHTLHKIVNINRVRILVNSLQVFDGSVLVTPITMNVNDTITIKVTKNVNSLSSFELLGTI